MANIGLNTIFPSARFLSTDNTGDIQELFGSDGSDASKTIQGIQVDAVAEGSSGNGITFSIVQNDGSDGVFLDGNTIKLSLLTSASDYKLNESTTVSAVTEVDASNTVDGIHFHAVEHGASGNGISLVIQGNQSDQGISANGNTITLNLSNDANKYQLSERTLDSEDSHTALQVEESIYVSSTGTISARDDSGISTTINVTAGDVFVVSAKDSSGRPIIQVSGENYALLANEYGTIWGKLVESISNILASATSAVTNIATFSIVGDDTDKLSGDSTTTLSNGVDGVSARTIPSISSLLSSADSNITDLVSFTITGSDDDSIDVESTVLDNGVDEVLPDLVPSSKYLLLNVEDIHDLETTEEADGRKVFWGLLETASNNIANSTNKSENLVINRGNLILVSDNKLRRSYNITATLDILDSDLSNES